MTEQPWALAIQSWMGAAIVLAVTLTCMWSVVTTRTIPPDLAPAWALVVGVYLGGNVSAQAAARTVAAFRESERVSDGPR